MAPELPRRTAVDCVVDFVMPKDVQQRALALAEHLLRSGYEPADGVPAPGSIAWDEARGRVAQTLLWIAFNVRSQGSASPERDGFALGDRAHAATHDLLRGVDARLRSELIDAAARAAAADHTR